MAGCFSNTDREDKAMEADLFRFLAFQQESDAVQVATEDLIQKSAKLEYAQQIVFDYECMQEKLPELIAAACTAKNAADGNAQFTVKAWLFEQLGREVAKMVEAEMKRIASFQENCDA